ncbi:PaaI family thioesterase [Aurantiacibacter hainanensis]|uniref:PaaI family thioesterase n=1 Tax=Aurantiacibacter hainanensis TaxID=3076114 RepID=UPI0030C6E579
MTEINSLPSWPSAKLMGAEYLSYDEDARSVEMAFTLPDEFAAMRGTAQGGLLAGPIDEAFGAVVFMATGGKLQLSLDITMSFLRPVPMERITVKARAVKAGRRVAFLEGELFDHEGNLCVRATATSMVTEWPGAKTG